MIPLLGSADDGAKAGAKAFRGKKAATSVAEVTDDIKMQGKLVVPNSGKLIFDPATRSWTSPGGLVYGQGSVHGNRVKHVLDHLVPNSGKAIHSVFNVDRTQLIGLLDGAWKTRIGPGILQPNGNRVWVVDMGRVVGTNGETYIQIVVKDGTANVITAFPKLVP